MTDPRVLGDWRFGAGEGKKNLEKEFCCEFFKNGATDHKLEKRKEKGKLISVAREPH
jgi:hypothetical protein